MRYGKPLNSALLIAWVSFLLTTTQNVQAAKSNNKPMPWAMTGAVVSFGFSCYLGKPPCVSGNYLDTDKLTASLDRGTDVDMTLSRLSLGADWNATVYEAENWKLSGRWDLNIHHWNTSMQQPEDKPPFKKSGSIIGVTPVFQYQWKSAQVKPYMELGGGLHFLLDEALIEDEIKSTQFQFGSILGFGAKTDKYELGYRYTHFSNANIRMPNPGTDVHAIHFGLRL